MIRLHLVRHGHCERPPGGGILGQYDAPLSEHGHRQARALALRLCDVPLVAAYSSDLQRAIHTARAALDSRAIEPRSDPRLREFNIGAWEGLGWDEIEARHPGSIAAFASPLAGLAFPEGERMADVARRVRDVIDDIMAVVPEGDVLVVGHHGSLTMLLAQAFGLPEWGWRHFLLDYASLTTLELHDGTPLLTRLNDCAHLLEVGQCPP